MFTLSTLFLCIQCSVVTQVTSLSVVIFILFSELKNTESITLSIDTFFVILSSFCIRFLLLQKQSSIRRIIYTMKTEVHKTAGEYS